jgi:hypothetical protein
VLVALSNLFIECLEHWRLPPVTGGSATGLSATGAWLSDAAGDGPNIVPKLR